MQIVLHAGVHGTDGDRLLTTLLDNREMLAAAGVEVARPARFRSLIEDTLLALKGGTATPEMEQVLLDALLDSAAPRRLVLSSPALIGPAHRAITQQGFYAQAGTRLAALARLFPTADIRVMLALKNPATLLRVLLAQATNDTYASLMRDHAPADLRWFGPVRGIVQALQGRHRLTLWCHEDVPLIWPEVVRQAAGLPADAPLRGGQVWLADLIGAAGMAALSAELAGRDAMSVDQRRAMHAGLIARHAPPEALEEPVELPGWTQETVDAVSTRYAADVAEIAVLPGVEFLLP